VAAEPNKDRVDVETTGHEWDGITEYNNPLPKWWLYLFYATIVWSAVYVVLYPSVPGFNGLLDFSQRAEFELDMTQAKSERAPWTRRVEIATLADIERDPALRRVAIAGGRAAFADNCAPCHGLGGGGRPGYPVLGDDDWLWGGSLGEIEQTIRHGIRADATDTRQSVMPNFGADGVLSRAEIADVADYVMRLAGRTIQDAPADRGAAIFRDNCAACHGPEGRGLKEFGAPNLTDSIWLNGGRKENIVAQIHRPNLGVMPAWGGRLDGATIKMLAIYIHALGGGQ
jgi:cytochrome c oxidase cbb3-type subunit III